MNIEQLVKQSGGEIRQPEAHFTEYVFSPKAIEAFAKALQQQSEPAFYVSKRSYDMVMTSASGISREKLLPDDVHCYTKPPNTVSLEEFYKLLNALKDLRDGKGLTKPIEQLIAEAEGKS